MRSHRESKYREAMLKNKRSQWVIYLAFSNKKKTDILQFKTHLHSRLTLWDGFYFLMCCSKSFDGLTFFKTKYYWTPKRFIPENLSFHYAGILEKLREHWTKWHQTHLIGWVLNPLGRRARKERAHNLHNLLVNSRFFKMKKYHYLIIICKKKDF